MGLNRKLKNFLFISIVAFLFLNACSTKEIYEPKVKVLKHKSLSNRDSGIVDVSSNVALLEDRKALISSGEVNVTIERNSRILSKSKEWILSATIDGNLTLQSLMNSDKKTFELKKTIASANVKDNTLAVLFADDEIALYELDSKKLTFKAEGNKALAVDSRIVPPYFMQDLVLFPTLDGKVIIVNAKLKKKLRTIIVSSKTNFNNIIYLDILDNKIVAATASAILSVAQKEVRAKYESRNIIFDGTNLYITTKQGEVLSLTTNLDVNGKIKFPFAHFLSVISDKDTLYLLEKAGYIIALNKNMKDYKVYAIDLDDGFVFNTEKTFNIDDKKISILSK